MANRTNEIGEIVKKAKVLLLDIEGTTTSISFVKDKLFPYAEENVKKYLESQWDTDDVKEALAGLRKLAVEDEENKVEGAVKIPAEDASKEDQIEGVVNNVKWLMSADRKVGPLKSLQGLIWKQGYDNGDIKGHVYDDVSPALEQWRAVEGQKVYIYSSGSVQAQKLLFAQSTAGDLLRYIDGHFDTAVGAKQEAASYTKIVEEIGCKADEILFLTDILKEAEAATASGLQAALLSREGNTPLPDDVTTSYPVLHSFSQLVPSNKRKPDAQDEPSLPAKVPKTENEKEVKPVSTEESSAKSEKVETEKMEVEEVTETNKTEEAKAEVDTPAKVETVVEEITDSNEAVDVPVITATPIITEEKSDSEKSESNNADKMDTDEKTPEVEQAKNGTAETKAEVSSSVITEIQEVTGDKVETAEVVDIQPVVEEPKSVENESDDLQNVGEILEKECDEILSKVQDLTNLDNIPVKPLNSIPEETMETENTDTNDIVDGILDSELEMQMKESENLEKNKATEVTEPSAETSAVAENGTTVENGAKVETTDTVKSDITEESTEQIEATSNGTEEKDKSAENRATEPTKVEEKTTNVEVKPEETITSTDSEVAAPKEELTEETKDKVEEVKVNGNGTNGNCDALNGDSKDEELSSRLAAENGKATNGANGDVNGAEDKRGEAEVTDIKVKTVAAAETHTDPIEQVTEA